MIFGTLRQNFSTANRDTNSLSRYQKFFETRHDSPKKMFGTEAKLFDGYCDTPSLSQCQNLYEKHRTVQLQKFSGNKTKTFGEEIEIPPLCFDTTVFLKHLTVPLQSFSVLLDRNFSKENGDTPYLDYRTFLKHKMVILRFFWFLKTTKTI